jgi:hypothetical protein
VLVSQNKDVHKDENNKVQVCYDQALAEVARRLGVLAHKGGQLGIAEWG